MKTKYVFMGLGVVCFWVAITIAVCSVFSQDKEMGSKTYARMQYDKHISLPEPAHNWSSAVNEKNKPWDGGVFGQAIGKSIDKNGLSIGFCILLSFIFGCVGYGLHLIEEQKRIATI